MIVISIQQLHFKLSPAKCCLFHSGLNVLIIWYNRGLQALQWRHNECNGISNHQPHDCLLKQLFRLRSKKTSKLHVIGLCAGNSPVTGEFLAQRASNAENVAIWWRHHDRMRHGTVHPWYLVVIVLQTTRERHPIARPYGRAMGCLREFKVWSMF